MRVDDVDLGVLELLRENGRATAQRIAETLGISPSAARQRLRRLLDTGVVRVLAVPDPSAIGAPLAYFVHFDIAGAHDDALNAVTSSVPNVSWVVLLDDSTRMALHATAAGLPELSAAVDGIRRSRTATGMLVEVVLRTHPAGPRPLGGPFTGEFTLDDVDRVLVRELEVDGRRSYTALAASTGLSVPSARERVLRLIQSQALQFHTIVDHEAIGMNARAGLGVRVRGPISEAVQQIAQLSAVTYVVEVAGSFDLRVEIACSDMNQRTASVRKIRELTAVDEVTEHPYATELVNNGIWL